MDIGHRMKELRIQYGLTQQELADRSELSKGFISQLERNLTSPSVSTLLDIIQCLGTTPAEFFTDQEPEQIVKAHRPLQHIAKFLCLMGQVSFRFPMGRKRHPHWLHYIFLGIGNDPLHFMAQILVFFLKIIFLPKHNLLWLLIRKKLRAEGGGAPFLRHFLLCGESGGIFLF